MAKIPRALIFLIVNAIYMLMLSMHVVAYLADFGGVINPHRHKGVDVFLARETTSTEASVDISSLQNVILFDGVCNFCNTWVDLLLRLDVDKKFKFASLQSEVGKELLERIGKKKGDISSVILLKSVSSKEHYSKSEAVLNVIRELRLGLAASAALSAVLPLSFRDDVYDIVAENRYSILGKRVECRCSDPRYSDRFLT